MTTDQATAEKIREVLTPPPGQRLYAVLDGAAVPGLPEKLHAGPRECFCLIPGWVGKELADAAPYVVELLPGSELAHWLIDEGWGRHWGVFAFSTGEKLTVRDHFRALFGVQGPDGRELYFRFYDPRVLRAYLPTCNPEELEAVFGPMQAYMTEAEDPARLIRFRLDKGVLARQDIPLSVRSEVRGGAT